MKDQQIEKAMGGIENRIRHIYNCGYQQGYEDGKKQQDKLWAGERYRQELTAKGYYRGLEDAWETAKQIVSKSSAKMSDIFGEVYAESVFEKFTADQAMKKIMDYESTQPPRRKWAIVKPNWKQVPKCRYCKYFDSVLMPCNNCKDNSEFEPAEARQIETETWSNIHGQTITVPKGTFDKIFNEVEDDEYDI